ncbi:hypothetical protein ND864_10105 [Leptospira levettii]|uniref:adenylate/guanylate cyclase domain-containing protein n=1 Tax=Leptospira levettii TaxID=2023178 RepID=UPI00223CD6DF|nr:hypothetical protein [Leptospira levettii]MCW7466059.1 hypothetical protein [Leptospira levettii]
MSNQNNNDDTPKTIKEFFEMIAKSNQNKIDLNKISSNNNVNLQALDILSKTLNNEKKPKRFSELVKEIENLHKEDQIKKLQLQIKNLERQNNSILRELSETGNDKSKNEAELKKLKLNLEEIEKKNQLAFLTNKVNKKAGEALVTNQKLSNKFLENGLEECVVLSIDIRRSTELMLKAKNPQLFTKFISLLSEKLKNIIIENYGVFDKFTGDGILAFFPNFFTGEDNLILAKKAADECHNAFNAIYNECRHCFITVSKETGLGIGFDYGEITFALINGEITIVGKPVVYACRLSSTSPNSTLCNQSVYDVLLERNIPFTFIEKDFDIKHEGRILAYDITIDWNNMKIKEPIWE